MMREEFLKRLYAGERVTCPCCDRFAQVYRRKVHAGIARELIKIYKLQRSNPYTNWVHFRDFASLSEGRDFTIARYWNLLERETSDDDAKKDSGYWRLTPEGKGYVTGVHKIQQIALVYNDEVIRFEGPLVTINDCLGDKFNYAELMGSAALSAYNNGERDDLSSRR